MPRDADGDAAARRGVEPGWLPEKGDGGDAASLDKIHTVAKSNDRQTGVATQNKTCATEFKHQDLPAEAISAKASKSLEKQEKRDILHTNKTVTGHTGTPKNDEPNAVIDHIGKKGSMDVRSFYNANGMKSMDIHTTDHGYPKQHPYGQHGEHAHDYEWDTNGRLKNKTTRELTDDERERNGDIL